MRVAVVLVLLAAVSAPAHAQNDGARREDHPAQPAKKPVMTKPPVLLQAVAPTYPEAAAAAGREADVKVRIQVSATGEVTQVDVPQPVGDGFDEAAVAAAKQYVFDPAEFDGVPGPIVVETTIHFTLEQQEVEPPPPPPAPTPGDDEAAHGPPSHGGDARLPIRIEGVALERGSRRKLSGVIVSIAELGVDAVTDEHGHFYFHGVAPGHYTVIAVDQRYARFKRTLDLTKGEKLDIRLWLRALGGNPYETVVEGERESLEVTKRTIERRQMTTVPGTFGDPIRVIQALPGLARSPFSTGFLLIRGSNPDDSGVFIDGHLIPLLFHFLGGPSVLNPEFLQSIELYPGGFPARFGRFHGGVVSVETRPAKSDGVHGSADVDLLDAGGYLRFPVGKHGALAIAGRRSYLDFMLGFFLPTPKPGNQLVVVPIYYDANLRYDHDFGSEGKLSVTFIGSSDQLDVVQSNAEEDSSLDLGSAVRFWRLIGNYRRPVGHGLSLELSPAIGRDTLALTTAQVDAGGAFNSVQADADVFSYRIRLHGEMSPTLTLDTGLDQEARVAHFHFLVPLDDNIRRPLGPINVDPSKLAFQVDSLAWGVYVDLGLRPTKRLRVVPGLRLDGYYLDGKPRGSIDPRLSAHYQIDDRWAAKAYAGIYHQPPQPEGLDSRFGNPKLGLERGIHTGLGAEWKPAGAARRVHWSVDGEAYYISRSNQAAFTQDVEVDPVTGEAHNVNFRSSRDGDTVGLELLIKRAITRHLFGWLSYTLSKTRTRHDPGDTYYPPRFDQRHTLNAVASYRTNGGWEFGARYRLATGAPITPITGSTFDADANSYTPLEGAFFSARRKAFNQLDVRVEKSWVFNTWLLGLYLDIQNVLNLDNVEATQWDYRYRDSAPVTSVPFLPTLGIKGQF